MADNSFNNTVESLFRRKVKPERRVRCSQPGSCQSGKMLKETSEDPRIRVFFAL